MFDITIIGAGPAGGSAGIFAAKAGKKTLVFDDGRSMTNDAVVYNHYGFKEVKGSKLLEFGKEQLEAFDANIVEQTIENISKTNNGFKIEAGDEIYETKHIIFASGTAIDLAKKIGVEIIDGTEPWIEKVIHVDSYGKTNIEGVWAAGTIAGTMVQTIVTSGHGAEVAINLLSELKDKRFVDHGI